MTRPAVPGSAGSMVARAQATSRQAATQLKAERFATFETLVAAAGCEPAIANGFQSVGWIAAIYRHLAPASNAEPHFLAVRSAQTGDACLLVPLEVRSERGVRIARFADLGVSDYTAPLGAGFGAPDAASAKAIVAALKPVLAGVDVLELLRMPVGGGNALAAHSAAQPSRHQGNALTVTDSVEAYIRSRGKKYRKEVERCYRVLESEGAWAFARAGTPSEIEAAFSALERQQAERHAGKADDYALAGSQFSAFYRDVLGDPNSAARIFTLSVNGAIVAVLLGLEHKDTFTLLRIANGGAAWKHVSPGRLIVVEAMKYFDALGVKTFDMGIGDYQFKRGFGAEPVALVDLVVPVSLRGMPYVAAARLKSHLRRIERFRALVARIRP